jgi:hypothetical protein
MKTVGVQLDCFVATVAPPPLIHSSLGSPLPAGSDGALAYVENLGDLTAGNAVRLLRNGAEAFLPGWTPSTQPPRGYRWRCTSLTMTGSVGASRTPGVVPLDAASRCACSTTSSGAVTTRPSSSPTCDGRASSPSRTTPTGSGARALPGPGPSASGLRPPVSSPRPPASSLRPTACQ